MKILYAGDSPVGGAANYLLGVLKLLKAETTHLAPDQVLTPSLLKNRYDGIVLSDFSKRKVPVASERAILRQVEKGTGLLMVGGWASFSGPYGGWKGSLVEEILPVTCLGRDDRLHIPSGAWMVPKAGHSMFRSLSFKDSPVIVGLNEVRPKKESRVVLEAETKKGRRHPLLIIGEKGAGKTAAFTTDLAPHWCGGLLDWGGRHVTIPVHDRIPIEVGTHYLRFVTSILKWLTSLK